MNYYEEKGDFLKYLRKTMRIMRLSLFLIVISTAMAFSATSYSQNTKLTLDLNNASVKEVLKAIENQSEFLFFYQEKHVDLNRHVTLHATEQDVETILNQLFAETDNIYVINDRQIVIGVAPRKELERQLVRLTENMKPIIDQPQQKEITGKVTDTDGLPLPGVSVVVKGTTTGTVTNNEGEFTLDISEEADTLQFSFVGMRTQEVAIEGRTTFTVVMEEDVIGMEEVVVVGYGTLERKNVTAAISSVTGEEMSKMANPSIDQILLGKIPGLEVTTGYAPGQSATTRIRGVNSVQGDNDPLYVIDGMIIESNSFSTGGSQGSNSNYRFDALAMINPADIESVDVLKDAASTSVYGARGANGVIIITTKSGSKDKTRLIFDTYFGMEVFPDEKKLDLLSGEEYARFYNEALINDGDNPLFGSHPNYPAPESNELPNTDWQDLTFRDYATKQNYSLSANGGTDNARYYISGGYYNQGTIFEGQNNLERYTFKTNLDFDLNSWVKAGTKITATKTLVEKGPSVDQATSGKEALDNSSLAGVAYTFPPIYNVRFNDTLYSYMNLPDVAGARDNPVAIINEIFSELDASRIIGTFFTEFSFLKSFQFLTSISGDFTGSQSRNYTPPTLDAGRNFNGSGNWRVNSRRKIIYENRLTYKNTFGDHQINAMGAFTVEHFKTDNVALGLRNVQNQKIHIRNLDYVTDFSGNSGINRSGYVSYLSRINYVFKDKYILQVIGRVDGSTSFPPGNRWAFFPSVSAAWRLNEEDFIRELDVFSNLKLRLAYGTLGNPGGGSSQFLTTASVNDLLFNDNLHIRISPNRIPNYDLKWETTASYNLGMDVGVLNERLKLTFEAYKKVTTDLILNAPLPLSSGFSNQILNIGSLSNRGIELSVSAVPVQTKDFSWNLGGNFFFNRQRLDDLGVAKESAGDLVVGYPTSGLVYGYIADGLFKDSVDLATSPAKDGDRVGFVKFKDIDGDGQITPNDKSIIGIRTPKFTYGINTGISYKRLEVSAFLQGKYGNMVTNNTWAFLSSMDPRSNQLREAYENRFIPGVNTDTNIPIATTEDNGARTNSTLTLENGSYLRLRNLQISYSIPQKFIHGFKVYFTMDNLFTITNYRGFNPDRSSEEFAYPLMRNYVFGLNLNL